MNTGIDSFEGIKVEKEWLRNADEAIRVKLVETFHRSRMTQRDFAAAYKISLSVLNIMLRRFRLLGAHGLKTKVSGRPRGDYSEVMAIVEYLTLHERRSLAFSLSQAKALAETNGWKVPSYQRAHYILGQKAKTSS